MKLTIDREALQTGLSRMQAVVDTRATMPVLSNVLLTASQEDGEGKLELGATNLEIGIRDVHRTSDTETNLTEGSEERSDESAAANKQQPVALHVEESGAIAVHARKLYDVARELSDRKVVIETTENNYVKLECGRAKFSIAGLDPDEYQSLPDMNAKRWVKIPSGILSDMVDSTLYAASTDETRYNLNGIYLETEPDEKKNVLRFVATDGHRLALRDAFVKGCGKMKSGIIIPRKGVMEMKRLADNDSPDEVEIGFSGNNLVARKAGTTINMRLIEGEFPEYKKVIPKPKELPVSATLSGEELVSSLRRVAPVADERSGAVRLTLEPGKLVVTVDNVDLGEASDEVVDVDYSGEKKKIAFRGKYISESAMALGVSRIVLSLKDSESPAMVCPAVADENDDGAEGETESKAVIMPMRM